MTAPTGSDDTRTASFGFREVPEAREGRPGARGLLLGRAQLRHHERPDERGRPPALEGRDGRMAQSAARLARAGRGRRHRRHRVPHRRPCAPARRRGARSRSATSMRTCWAKAWRALPRRARPGSNGSAAMPRSLPVPDASHGRLYDRLRHPQRDTYRPRAGRSAPRAEAGRALPVPGILPCRGTGPG